MIPPTKLCLIDANSLFYRAFFAIKAQLSTTTGQPTNAVFGFVKMLNRILDELEPEYIGVCFDVGKRTHRTEKFAAYKAQRPPMPDSLVSQVPYIKEVVSAYNFTACEAEGFEADDVIASITRRLAGKVGKVVIVSSDKDILQLVADNVEVYNPYKDEGIVFTQEVVKEKFGVEPERIPDLISLAGDPSDNIPGCRGIGEKTARELLKEFSRVEDLLKDPSRIKREALRKVIEDNRKDIVLSKELAELRTDVPVTTDLKDFKVRPADTDKLWDLYSRLEFKALLKGLSEARLSSVPAPGLDIPRRKATDFPELAAKIRQQGSFAFFIDKETAGQGVLSANIAIDGQGVYEVDDARFLKALFAGPDLLAATHDVKAHRHMLSRFGIASSVKFFDTMLAAYLAESSRPAQDLEGLLWNYLDLKGLSRLDYFAKESHFLLKLKDILERSLKEKGLLDLFYGVEMPLSEVLFEMEATGISLDEKALKILSRELDRKLEKLIASIYKLAGCEFNINSPKQLSEVLFNKLKFPVVKKTKTGVSTDEEVLTRLARDYELPKVLLEFRQVMKLKTTYVDALPELIGKETGKIHSHFNQTGTETGRLSSSSPNLQNIPVKTELGRRIRQAFIPSAGFDGLLTADYSQVELRILAHLSADEALIDAFAKDLDIHRHTASLVFGVDEKDVTDEMRDNSKRVNFGIVYGMSAYGLAKDLGVDTKTAQDFIDEYFLRYPKVRTYLDGQIRFVKEHGYVATILGRRRYIPEIANTNMGIRQFAERQAINAPIQGSAADLIKRAMVAIHAGIKKEGFASRLVLQVHDELVFEVKKEEKKGLIGLVRGCMEKALTLRVPLKTTMSYGKNWLDTEEVL